MLSKNYILHTAQLGHKSNYFKYTKCDSSPSGTPNTEPLFTPECTDTQVLHFQTRSSVVSRQFQQHVLAPTTAGTAQSL